MNTMKVITVGEESVVVSKEQERVSGGLCFVFLIWVLFFITPILYPRFRLFFSKYTLYFKIF